MITPDNMKQYDTKADAITAAKALRAQGQDVKVYRHAGIYTQPGRGVAAFTYYTVR